MANAMFPTDFNNSNLIGWLRSGDIPPMPIRLTTGAYAHSSGPGAEWFRDIDAADSLQLFGPRRSITPPAAGERVVLVGDETSIALAAALNAHGVELSSVFETRHPEVLPQVLDHFGLSAEIVPAAQGPDRAELLERARSLVAGTPAPQRLVVTGDAATVHALKRGSRTWPSPPAAFTGKAYWATGRTGLD